VVDNSVQTVAYSVSSQDVNRARARVYVCVCVWSVSLGLGGVEEQKTGNDELLSGDAYRRQHSRA
jgi:hypothetical protein